MAGVSAFISGSNVSNGIDAPRRAGRWHKGTRTRCAVSTRDNRFSILHCVHNKKQAVAEPLVRVDGLRYRVKGGRRKPARPQLAAALFDFFPPA